VILLISASWVARMTGMSHQCLAMLCHFDYWIGNVLRVIISMFTSL
jgi:hypothetical protein